MRRFSQKAVSLPNFFLMICTKEDNNTKTVSASRCGSHNGGARQELWSYLNSPPTREKAVPRKNSGTNTVKMSRGSVHVILDAFCHTWPLLWKQSKKVKTLQVLYLHWELGNHQTAQHSTSVIVVPHVNTIPLHEGLLCEGFQISLSESLTQRLIH